MTGIRAPAAPELGALLDEALPGRCAGGLALVTGEAAGEVVAWRPASLPAEPAFLAYSITKTLIAALALRLQEEGRVSLDADVAPLLPELGGWRGVTLRRLLQHTAGVPDYGALPAYHEAVRRAPAAPWGEHELAAHTWRRGPLFEPGSGFAYSNPGFLLARRALERAAGRGFGELVAERIARPLGLTRTFVAVAPGDLLRLAPGSSTALSIDGRHCDFRGLYHPGWVSHGVVASTASELARFLHALLAGRLVGEVSLRELTALVRVPRSQAAGAWREPSYGLGLMADPASPFGPLFGHDGGGPGHGASAFAAPTLCAGGAAACAMVGLEDELLAERLVRAALARAAERPIAGADPW